MFHADFGSPQLLVSWLNKRSGQSYPELNSVTPQEKWRNLYEKDDANKITDNRPVVALSVTFNTARAQAAPEIVSVDWLSQQFSDTNLVLFHVGGKTEFDKARLPNAQYISLRDITATRDNGKISTELPPAEELRKTVEKQQRRGTKTQPYAPRTFTGSVLSMMTRGR